MDKESLKDSSNLPKSQKISPYAEIPRSNSRFSYFCDRKQSLLRKKSKQNPIIPKERQSFHQHQFKKGGKLHVRKRKQFFREKA